MTWSAAAEAGTGTGNELSRDFLGLAGFLGLECVRKPLAHALALRKQMMALAKWMKASLNFHDRPIT